MSIRRQIFMIMLVALATAIVGSRLITETVLLDGFVRLEEQDTRLNVERPLDALAFDLEGLERALGDWSSWDDAYVFFRIGTWHFSRAISAIAP